MIGGTIGVDSSLVEHLTCQQGHRLESCIGHTFSSVYLNGAQRGA